MKTNELNENNEGNEINSHIMNLKRSRMHYSPYKHVKDLVTSTKDIYSERSTLKSVSFDDKSIYYITSIIVADVQENQKFRRVECLKLLKRIITNRSSSDAFHKELIDKLYYLVQAFILFSNDDLQSTLYSYISNQPLSEEQLTWLIEHHLESSYIVELLLHYPVRNEIITEWAREILNSGKLQDRVPELIGILIDEDIPEGIDVDHATLMWSIYYSKCTKSQKRKLLLKYLDVMDYSHALEVAQRLGIGEISKKLLKHYRGRRELFENSIT